MRLTSRQADGVQVVRVEAERIDAAAAIQFKDEMRRCTAEGPDRVVLDLAEVDFVDSSGLGAIVAAMKDLGADRQLDLAALSPAVEKVFRLTRMDTVFAIFGSAESALAGDPR